MSKYLLLLALSVLLLACDSSDIFVKNEINKLGFQEIIEPRQTDDNYIVTYVKDQYDNCFMIIYSPNGHGSALSPATVPCSSIIKPKKEGCE